MHGIQMARRGRKRKFRGSNPVGSTRRPDDRLLSSLQPHRRCLPRDLRLSEKAESMLGRLNLKNLISDDLCESGRLYALSKGRYRSIIGGPTGTAGGGRGWDCNPIGCIPDQCRCLRLTADYLSARFALSSAGDEALKAVETVALYDGAPDRIENLKCGLEALCVHYGLTNHGKSDSRRNTN